MNRLNVSKWAFADMSATKSVSSKLDEKSNIQEKKSVGNDRRPATHDKQMYMQIYEYFSAYVKGNPIFATFLSLV